MTIDIGSAEPAPITGDARQVARQAQEARRRQRVIKLVMLAAATRTVLDKRTLAGVIVLGIAVAAAKGLAQERGTPGLDWYRARGRDESRSPA
jgi:hypothetical protein